MAAQKRRCYWVDSCTEKYHDEEWGVPSHDDKYLFEMLILESFQAGISWVIVLKKRDGFRKAFQNFDVEAVSEFSDEKVDELSGFDGIIKSKAKIKAAVGNAKVFISIQKEFGSFSNYLWSYTDNKVIKITNDTLPPDKAELPQTVSKDLKKRGMKFLGPVITFAYLQAVGVVNNHDTVCYKNKE